MGNNPVLHTDPNGDALPLVVFAVAGAIGGVGNLYSNWGNTKSFADGLSYFVNGAIGGAVSVVNPLAGAAITGGANLVTDAINGTLSNVIADGRLLEHVLWSAVEGAGVAGSGAAAKSISANFGWIEYNSIVQMSPAEIEALKLPEGTQLSTSTQISANARKVVTNLPSTAANAVKMVSSGSAAKTSTSIWSSTSKLSSVKNAFGHWKKHAAEFPEFVNAKQYVEGAKNFLNNSPAGTLMKTRANGDILKYHPGTNTFGVMDATGVPRTMFRPTDGMKYWLGQ